jgi:mono/diheme cytochrome c family protein
VPAGKIPTLARLRSRRWGTSTVWGISAVLLLALVGMLTGCREDMQNQPRFKPLRKSDFYEDGRSSRPVIPGTIARGQLRADSYLYTGMAGKAAGDSMPFPVTREVLERGRERFNIYCAPCHSRMGDGNGMIVQRGYRRPPSYHIDRLRKAPLGHFFDVMTNGFGAMPDYAAQIAPHDRWAIAAYIRALQLSQNAPAGLVPAGTTMPSEPPPLPGTPGSGATPAQAEPSSGNLRHERQPAGAQEQKQKVEPK